MHQPKITSDVSIAIDTIAQHSMEESLEKIEVNSDRRRRFFSHRRPTSQGNKE